MNENPLPASPPGQNTSDQIRLGLSWIAEGWQLVRNHQSIWLRMSAVYLAFALLLKLIPFMGDLLLILITPVLLAGVIWGAAQGNYTPAELAPTGGRFLVPVLFQIFIAQPAQELMRIFNEEEKVFGAVLLGIISLGLIMLVRITGYLLIGGSMLTGLLATQFGVPQITTLVGMLVVILVYVALAMGLLFSVPLTVLGNRQPLAAISESFSTFRHNAVPLFTLSLPFVILYFVIWASFITHTSLGIVLVITAGLLALPLFVASVYCSFLSLFPLNHPHQSDTGS